MKQPVNRLYKLVGLLGTGLLVIFVIIPTVILVSTLAILHKSNRLYMLVSVLIAMVLLAKWMRLMPRF
ncbi:hypothetical protein GO755_40550 [Spirosoma sp. HMF4905]|uniref:Uncharacterized protein n=1 Tax=Spirosoma arboris TaxID=2682092 RepID=A0A7K1SRE3_9BACT|nr:hypothetical protein [Spirosoma arboris]MVM36361.1 hypothetical protein [Spirosoma arboris]